MTLQAPGAWRRLVGALNGPAHRAALLVFLAVVLGHMAEHLVQMTQIAMGTPRPQALGILGGVWPWLVHSEWLHYAYALATLAGLLLLRPAFRGTAGAWWDAALALQIWHHLEHLLLLAQVLSGWHLGGRAAPTSFLQLFFPRAELHMAYNMMVFVPFIVALVMHWRPRRVRDVQECACGVESGT